MEKMWEPNDEISEEDELVVTEHRDFDTAIDDPDELAPIETTIPEGEDVLEEYGEDVSSSPAQRGHDIPPDTGEDY